MAALIALRSLASETSIRQRCLEAIREAQGRAIRDNSEIPGWAMQPPDDFLENAMKLIITHGEIPNQFEEKWRQWIEKAENASANSNLGEFIEDEQIRGVIAETKTKIFGA